MPLAVHVVGAMMEDIRNPLRDRGERTREPSIVEEFKPGLEKALNCKRHRVERPTMLFCEQTKLKYSRLPEEEKRELARIAQKSQFIKGPVSQWGKKRWPDRRKPRFMVDYGQDGPELRTTTGLLTDQGPQKTQAIFSADETKNAGKPL